MRECPALQQADANVEADVALLEQVPQVGYYHAAAWTLFMM